MSDLDLQDLRDQIGSAVWMPHFDEVLARGRRRRRVRIGTALAAAVVAVGGGALVLEQPAASDRGIEPADVLKTDPAAAQIVDSPDAVLQDYVVTDTGMAYAVWDASCSDVPCPTAAAWSDDDWDSRVVVRIPSETQWAATDAGFVGMPYGEPAYLVTPAGAHVDLTERRVARPATGDEVTVEGIGVSSFRLIDPDTAQSWPAPEPAGVKVYNLEVLESGEVRAIGTAENGKRVLARSTDGGVTWSRTPWPASSGRTFHAQSHIAVLETLVGTEVSPPIRLSVSADAGRTWSVVEGEELPFASSGCMTGTSQALLVTAGEQLWRTTDDAWLQFEQVPDAPELDCAQEYDGTLVGTSPDGQSAYVSTDVGATWTEVPTR